MSPFANAAGPAMTSRTADSGVAAATAFPPRVFTKEAVDGALDEIRPFLVQDGGNIRVLSVEPSSKSVLVELQGACGSCPASATTMKMGVERVR
jgi:hypothetical protein